MTKKIIASLGLLLLVGAGLANYESSSWSTVYPGTFNFHASVNNGNVSMSWKKFSVPSGKSFAYYKVIRSQEKSNPVYPEDGYITYNSDLNFTSYTDDNPLVGTTYYRVCAILEGQKRYCSNVVKVAIKETSNETQHETSIDDSGSDVTEQPKEEVKTSSTGLSDATKQQLDAIATEFLSKVNAKYGSDTSKKNAFLTTIIVQLDVLTKKNSKLKPLVSYLKSKIQSQIDTLDEIKSILNVE